MRSIFIALLALVILTSINQPVKRQQTAPARVKPALAQKLNKQPTAKIEPLTTPIQQPTCEAEIIKYDWQHETATAICYAESSGNPNASNMNDHHATCDGSYSLMQVGCFWYSYFGYTEADFYNPEINTLIAYKIYKRQNGFTAWSTYTSGAYLRYIK